MIQRHAQFVHHCFAHHQAYATYFAMVPEKIMATTCVLSGQDPAVHIVEICLVNTKDVSARWTLDYTGSKRLHHDK